MLRLRVGQRAPGLCQPETPIPPTSSEIAAMPANRAVNVRLLLETVCSSGERAGLTDCLQDAKLLQFHSDKEWYRLRLFLVRMTHG